MKSYQEARIVSSQRAKDRIRHISRDEDHTNVGGGLIDFDDVSAAVDGFWSGRRDLYP